MLSDIKLADIYDEQFRKSDLIKDITNMISELPKLELHLLSENTLRDLRNHIKRDKQLLQEMHKNNQNMFLQLRKYHELEEE